MNDINERLEIILGLALLWSFYWFAVREAALDWLRQKLFKIRGDLFDEVANQRIDLTFDSKEYVELRRFMNGVIRYGYMISPIKVLLYKLQTSIALLRGGHSYADLNAPSNLGIDQFESGAHASLIKKYKYRIYGNMAVYFIFTSPAFCLLSVFVVAAVIMSVGAAMSKDVLLAAFSDRYFEKEFKNEVAAFDDCDMKLA